MPHWHVRVKHPASRTLRLSHIQPDDTGGVWAGEVLLWRGAPSWDSHRELLAAAERITNPAVNRDMVRHTWTWDLPEWWEGAWNCGGDRRYMTLSASGGTMNWQLVLRFPPHTPVFVFAAVAAGFDAELQGAPAARTHRIEGAVADPAAKVAFEVVETNTLPIQDDATMPGCQAALCIARSRRGQSRARVIATANRPTQEAP